jgi:hypothetical protein
MAFSEDRQAVDRYEMYETNSIFRLVSNEG